tara:strand:+ start:475 stop:1596 length:1122 start_codon:yes stop_codon:yes gene_type:complete
MPGPLAIGLMVGTAAFGIAKLAGMSTKKALGIGLLGGLGAGGLKALLTAPATKISAVQQGLGMSAGAGSTTAAQLAASTGGGTASFMGGAGATGIGGGAAFGSGVGGGVPAFMGGKAAALGQATPGITAGTFSAVDAAGNVVPLGDPATQAIRKVGETFVGSGAPQASSGLLSQAGQFIKENPFTTIAGGGALLSMANQPKMQPYSETPQGAFSEQEYEDALVRQKERFAGTKDTYPYPEDEEEPLTPENIYDRQEMMYANQGGLASFREGGVNYLPSKSDHDEKDSTNYVRATGYVEDGSGNGDKDEDTMLAQLADGEFVSRADAVLGAGIMQGANPEDFKDMRRKGAQFFYKQQDQLKRIYDIVNDGNKTS